MTPGVNEAVPSTHTFKVVVAGSFASGKTTLIEHISDTEVVGTEAPTSGAEAGVKQTTTVGMEYGTLTIGEGAAAVTLALYGVPGQARFRFLWDIVAEGTDGFLLLVDARQPATWPETVEMAAHFRSQTSVPLVIGVNRTGGDPELMASVVESLALAGVEYVECEVIEADSARNALVSVLLEILDDLDRREAQAPDARPRAEELA